MKTKEESCCGLQFVSICKTQLLRRAMRTEAEALLGEVELAFPLVYFPVSHLVYHSHFAAAASSDARATDWTACEPRHPASL